MVAGPVAMFPLGTVLFPHATLPLHVFEPRYRAMVRDLLAGDRELGIVLIERGSEVGGGDVRFGVGTRARVEHAEELPDGRWALVTVGVDRLRVVEWLPDAPYPRALVEPRPDPEPTAADAARRDEAAGALRDLFDALARFDPRAAGVEVALDADPRRASYEAAGLLPVGPLDAQRLLEQGDAGSRLALVAELARDARALLRRRGDGA